MFSSVITWQLNRSAVTEYTARDSQQTSWVLLTKTTPSRNRTQKQLIPRRANTPATLSTPPYTVLQLQYAISKTEGKELTWTVCLCYSFLVAQSGEFSSVHVYLFLHKLPPVAEFVPINLNSAQKLSTCSNFSTNTDNSIPTFVLDTRVFYCWSHYMSFAGLPTKLQCLKFFSENPYSWMCCISTLCSVITFSLFNM